MVVSCFYNVKPNRQLQLELERSPVVVMVIPMQVCVVWLQCTEQKKLRRVMKGTSRAALC